MLTQIQRPTRALFWTLGLTLYLIPILLLSLQVDGYLFPLFALLYAAISWQVVGRLWPEGEETLLQEKDQQIAELSREVTSLRQQEEVEPPSCEVHSQYDAYVLLQHCIQRAQRLQDVSQLFDAFRAEMGAIILVYAPAERRLLFANSLVQEACGIDPENFVRGFDAIVRGGRDRWESAIHGLSNGQEACVRLLLATTSGQSLTLDACLGAIPSGPLRDLVVAVLYCE